ncbi:hypothetical protein [Tautonia sociabilis]|uniref:Uncharacterized protein n=1 Tax=Tautonia sociabilis TaxID=2080755 RepID=A0A432MLL3_9BACT|nr:hypothetical protein [Tautonia sociabilis]RUL88303.1 hypothetical protein TsocGM_08185 [Tautonia sociabilis]
MSTVVEAPGPGAVLARWAGRIASLLSLGLLSLFVAAEPPWPWRLSPLEGALVLCFPVATALGMVLAWWREGWGGLVTVLGVSEFSLIHLAGTGRLPGGPWFLIFSSPAVGFLASWALRGGFRRWPRWARGRRETGWSE